WWGRALRRSGRFIVTVAKSPERSTRMCSNSIVRSIVLRCDYVQSGLDRLRLAPQAARSVGVPGGLVVAGRGAAVSGFGRGDRGRLVLGEHAPAGLGTSEAGDAARDRPILRPRGPLGRPPAARRAVPPTGGRTLLGEEPPPRWRAPPAPTAARTSRRCPAPSWPRAARPAVETTR